MSEVRNESLAIESSDGHRFQLQLCLPESPRASLLWLPALGVAARHYLPFAEPLAARGIAVALHEWRGHGSSSLRANRENNWGYRQLLLEDIPASASALANALPGLPRINGGHSLGGQLTCIRAGLAADEVDAVWLVASGAPYWRAFPAPLRWGLPLLYRFVPWLTRRAGRLQGRRIGFGGNEARGVMDDWARTGLSGRYAVEDIAIDIDAAMAAASPPVQALVMAEDWLAPASSTRHLLSCLPRAGHTLDVLDGKTLHGGADHFAWMRKPDVVVERLLAGLPL